MHWQVGPATGQTQDILSRRFESLSPIRAGMVSYGGSKHNVSILVPSGCKKQTLQELNRGCLGCEGDG